MWLGLPVVAFDVSFNRATTEDQALYFADSTSLRNHVQALLGMLTPVRNCRRACMKLPTAVTAGRW